MKRTDRLLQPIILSLSLLCVRPVMIHADRIQYSYDAIGNRILSERELPLRNNGNGSPSDTISRHDMLSSHRITILPNPTDGRLIVEITGIETVDNTSIVVYNNNGSIVYSNAQIQAENEIDLTSCPSGMYLLIIKLDNETKIWKIIKI